MKYIAKLQPDCPLATYWKAKQIKKATIFGVDWEMGTDGEYWGMVAKGKEIEAMENEDMIVSIASYIPPEALAA